MQFFSLVCTICSSNMLNMFLSLGLCTIYLSFLNAFPLQILSTYRLLYALVSGIFSNIALSERTSLPTLPAIVILPVTLYSFTCFISLLGTLQCFSSTNLLCFLFLKFIVCFLPLKFKLLDDRSFIFIGISPHQEQCLPLVRAQKIFGNEYMN